MTTDRDKRQSPPDSPVSSPTKDMGPARRRAISAIVAEDLEVFTQARRAAQRKLVHNLENCATTADIRRWHCLFATEAARDYAAHALRFDALIEKLALDPSSPP